MRMAFLDEAGIANPAHEPFVVVAGVLVNADKEWQAVERHLSDLADHFVPADKRDGFHFHATELFSGGKNFTREKWSREDRWKILDELVAIPLKFKLPIVAGWTERAKLAAKYPNESVATVTIHAQTVAFAICTYGIDLYMQQAASVQPGEVASIIMENNDQARQQIKKFHQFNRDPKNAAMLQSLQFGEMVIKRIVGNPSFQEKSDSSLLQVADACAFAIKRHLMKTAESERFYTPLRKGMVILPKDELPPSASPSASDWAGQSLEKPDELQ